jgi:hypothetical protein
LFLLYFSSPRTHFSKNTHKTPIASKDPGPNPIILDDLKVAAVKGNKDTIEKLLDQGNFYTHVFAHILD